LRILGVRAKKLCGPRQVPSFRRALGLILRAIRSVESFGEPRLPLSQATPELGDEFSDCDVNVRIDGAPVDVSARQCEPCAGGKARLRAVVPSEDDFSCNRIMRKARYWADLLTRKPAQRIA